MKFQSQRRDESSSQRLVMKYFPLVGDTEATEVCLCVLVVVLMSVL